MARSTIEKLHKWFSWLVEGKFTEEDFRKEFPAEHQEGQRGWTAVGEMSAERKQLIISDAKRHKEALEKKTKVIKLPGNKFERVLAYPYLTGQEEKVVQEEKNVLEKIAEEKQKKETSKKSK